MEEDVFSGSEELLFDGTEVGTEEELADADGAEEEYLAEVKRVEEEENGAVQPVVMVCEYY